MTIRPAYCRILYIFFRQSSSDSRIPLFSSSFRYSLHLVRDKFSNSHSCGALMAPCCWSSSVIISFTFIFLTLGEVFSRLFDRYKNINWSTFSATSSRVEFISFIMSSSPVSLNFLKISVSKRWFRDIAFSFSLIFSALDKESSFSFSIFRELKNSIIWYPIVDRQFKLFSVNWS